MSKTLIVSDETYEKLEALARFRGFQNVEQFLEQDEQLAARQKELARRRENGESIRNFQKQMREKYGEMSDSVELIREDRMR